MKCRKCKKRFELNQLMPMPLKPHPITKHQRWAMLCKTCRKAIDNRVEPDEL